MKDAIRNYKPATNWITTGLLTLVITSFGIYTEIHASDGEITFTDVSADLSAGVSSHSKQSPLVCDGKNLVEKQSTVFLYR